MADFPATRRDRGHVLDDDLPEQLQRWRWEVGDRIRAIRRERGVTQEELAHRLGIARNTMGRWETGQHPMSIDQVARIAWALDVEPWRLFKDDHDTSSSPEA